MKEPKFLNSIIGISSVLTLREAGYRVSTGGEWDLFSILGLVLIAIIIFLVVKQKTIWTAYCYIVYLITNLTACLVSMMEVYQRKNRHFFESLFDIVEYQFLLLNCVIIAFTLIITIFLTNELHVEIRNRDLELSRGKARDDI